MSEFATNLLSHATEFSWDATPENAYPADRGIWTVDLVRMRQEDGSFLWAIRRDGSSSVAWTRLGEWEHEGIPSGRRADYLTRARWTFDEALAEVERLLPIYRAQRRADMDLHFAAETKARPKRKRARGGR